MKTRIIFIRIILLFSVLAGFLLAFSGLETGAFIKGPDRQSAQTGKEAPDLGQTLETLEPSWPLLFIPNYGQLDSEVKFYVLGRDKHIYFRKNGLTIGLTRKAGQNAYQNAYLENILSLSDRINNIYLNSPFNQESAFFEPGRWVVGLDFVGASPEAVEAQDKAETVVSFFKGPEESWLTGLSSYRRVIYRNLWPGIDLSFSGNRNHLKYELVINPGADVSCIKMSYRGAEDIRLNEEGAIEVFTPVGSFQDEAPAAYQLKNGRQVKVQAFFEILEKQMGEDGLVSSLHTIRLGPYDPGLPLYLDPAILIYSGYLGGSSNDRALGIALDSAGNVYLAGWTASIDFPVTVGPDLSFNGPSLGTDAFVAKVNPSGTGLVYCGFLGGSYDDGATGLAVDSAGNAYVGGYTKSVDFPVYLGPYTTPAAGVVQYGDGFIAKINASGTGLVYSGFLGGSSADVVSAVAVDSSGRAYVCGTTESSNFPVKAGPDTSYNGQKDVFILRVAASGQSLDWSGFIGGTRDDIGTGLALDSFANSYVIGHTTSTQANLFPVKTGPFLTHKGGLDAFVAKVSASGAGLVYCGFIGGTGDDYGSGIAVDGDGCAYITGATLSTSGFPVILGPDLTWNGLADAFVAKVNQSGSGLIYCGYLGGSADDFGLSIAVEAQGIVSLVGATDSADFPVIGGPYSSYSGNRDAFFAVLAADGQNLIYSSFLGGSGREEANAVAADGTGNFFLAGFTTSPDFPVLVGPFTRPGGGVGLLAEDAFVSRICVLLPPAAPENLRLNLVTDTTAVIAWEDKSSNESGFKIERKTGTVGTWSQIALVGANVVTYQDSGLNEATSYFYRVKAYNSAGDSKYSNELNVLTRPAAPSGLEAVAVHERRVNLSWTYNSAGETGIRIERKTGAGNWIALANVAANSTTYADLSVVESTTYTYRVFAYNASGDSNSSNEATVTTPALTIPAAPSGLQATAISATQVRLNWIDNSYNEDGFKVERKTGAGGTWEQIGVVAENSGVFIDSGLSELTTYYYRVRAFNLAGNSDYSNEAVVTTPENRPRLRVPVAGIEFGSLHVCESRNSQMAIFNDGGAELLVSSIVRSSGSTAFSYVGPDTPFTIPPFGSRILTIRFNPYDPGPAEAIFGLISNDPDHPEVSFVVSGSALIPVINLSLEVEKRTERAWIIRRDYGYITVVVNKEVPYTVARYRLWRKPVAGGYELRREFIESDFSYGRLVYIDKYLDKGKSYVYRIEALDCTGRVIAASETGTQPASVREKSNLRPERVIKD